MDKNATQYIFGFALAVCLICSFFLTVVSQGLKSKQEINRSLDKKKHILKVVNLKNPLSSKPLAEEILKVYDEKIMEVFIDSKEGTVLKENTENSKNTLYPLYIYREEQKVVAYAFPVVGQGLWSTLYGYLSLEANAEEVRGLTFSEHGETPGLGAEIEKDWFQKNFKGKSIWDSKKNKLMSVTVVKGKVDNVIKDADKKQYYVDGISGATITSRGVTMMLKKELNKYEPFFGKVRKKIKR